MKTKQFKQEIREAIDNLLEQGRPSMRGNSCAYRDDTGNRCAIGLMMDDEEIEKYASVEGSTIGVIRAGWRKDVYSDQQEQELNDFQMCHDDARLHKAGDMFRIAFIEKLDNYDILPKKEIKQLLRKYQGEDYAV